MPRVYFIESALTDAVTTLVLFVETQNGTSTLKLAAVQDVNQHKFEVHEKGLIRNQSLGDGRGFLHRPDPGSNHLSVKMGDPTNPDAHQVWEFHHIGEYTFIVPPQVADSGPPLLLTATAENAEVVLSPLAFPIPTGQVWKFIPA